MASNKDLYKEFDVKLVTKWECPEGGGAPIITMPNIPKPLHHQNPRNLLGAAVWNRMRRRCYTLADMTCEICGNRQEKGYCDAHELYDIDYATGTSRFVRTICLCRLCHRYGIHTGRCVTLFKDGNPIMTKDVLLAGAENAFSLVSEWNKKHKEEEPLRLYANWLEYLRCEELNQPMRELIKKYKAKFYMEDPKQTAKWSSWSLWIGDREYPTPYENEKAWRKAMEEASKKDSARIYGARKKKFTSVDDVEITEHDLQKIEKAEIPEGF